MSMSIGCGEEEVVDHGLYSVGKQCMHRKMQKKNERGDICGSIQKSSAGFISISRCRQRKVGKRRYLALWSEK